MLTLKNVRVEVATYGQRALRDAGESVLARLEALVERQADSTRITSEHLDVIAKTATDAQELVVVRELRKLDADEVHRAPARLSSSDTPVLERTRRISDMIASTLGDGAPQSR